jgi:hypothetical protein
MADHAVTEKQKGEGAKYVLVKADGEEGSPETSNGNESDSKDGDDCPDIIYKVQYKDFSGDIKGTKILDAPYKMKKTV